MIRVVDSIVPVPVPVPVPDEPNPLCPGAVRDSLNDGSPQ
jgi:hypothetical protein